MALGGGLGEYRDESVGGRTAEIRGKPEHAPSQGERANGSGGWNVVAGHLLGLIAKRRRRQERLVASLNHLASAISSTLAPEDVLETVVDEVKELVRTDKAVLCLFSQTGPGVTLDDRAVFVRGRRDQHPESWWRAQIEEIAAATVDSGETRLASTREAWLLTVPVKIKTRPIGVLGAINVRSRRFGDDDVALMAILGAFAGTIIENERLHAESSYALLAHERNRIAKEMHDGLSQSLFSASLEIDVARKRHKAHPEEVDRRLERIQSIIVRSLSELRRYIYDLRPVSLDKLGLAGAIGQRAKEIGTAPGLSTRVYVEGETRALPPAAEACAYRVAQEAIANAAKHARASHLFVALKYGATSFELRVEDDGRGFDVESARQGADAEESLGLRSMQDRVDAEGGTLTITSSDRGTTVKAVLPC